MYIDHFLLFLKTYFNSTRLQVALIGTAVMCGVRQLIITTKYIPFIIKNSTLVHKTSSIPKYSQTINHDF